MICLWTCIIPVLCIFYFTFQSYDLLKISSLIKKDKQMVVEVILRRLQHRAKKINNDDDSWYIYM